MDNLILSGKWLSTYFYQKGDFSQHLLMFQFNTQIGYFVGQSMLNHEGSALMMHLKYDVLNRVLTGVWQERTSPGGQYRGRVFHGASQFILNADGNKAEGRWVGFDSNNSKVNCGFWRLEKR